ncbi:unnamed protein product (macronuclear) [Paramecium tetraurelia]|uniref:Uncharacterized protein n=1 Tax=Paramecium tetraurelia TaxID=5888 RepID=A0DBW6_PARTE|nr:uncharacterized protein GSPATT00015410001 [Paramecium tetraurelia]CAK80533.1 unnamed protein product [Paramecium tetraurelia]|eukprot:XP_001447930.1 hypothetical protein (macronuclear) [Paramecium tetraurelia strain d4-2]
MGQQRKTKKLYHIKYIITTENYPQNQLVLQEIILRLKYHLEEKKNQRINN